MPPRHEHVDELLKAGERWELRFIRTLDRPAAEVWAALTEPERLSAWFPFVVEGECAAGATLRFVPRDGSGEGFEGVVVTCDRPNRFEFRWAGGEDVRFDPESLGARTLLTLVNTIDDVGKAAREAAGWHVTLDALAAHLAGREQEPPSSERFLELFRDYAQSFGDDASTTAPPAAAQPQRTT
ncbi:MAG: hypothetical protein QOH72_4852 [Solirubrobacteraceae bacterium]|jgi:uncharacterized protein YndB with AHSA1/START domain|nr:hypothetical protein [Solirubrobacteraceae bacterium]